MLRACGEMTEERYCTPVPAALRWLVPHLSVEVRKGACPARILRLTISTHSCELLASNAPDYS